MWLLPWHPESSLRSKYDVDDRVTTYDDKSIFTLFEGREKDKPCDNKVSIFKFEYQDSNKSLIDHAKQYLKRIKTIRHPSVLKYLDSYETEKSICIVTEAVAPLASIFEERPPFSNDVLKNEKELLPQYGLLQVAKFLQFLNNDCQLNHNNINIHSIFINESGIWKVGGFEYICPIDDSPPPRFDKLPEKYTPPERINPTKGRFPGKPYAVDSWGFGCLVWEYFNQPLTPSSSLRIAGKIPKPLSVFYNKLVQSSPKHRISPMDFVKDCKEANVFFNSPLLEIVLTLEEIYLLQDATEKAEFFERVKNSYHKFPKNFGQEKILPELINAFEYGAAGPTILDPILAVVKICFLSGDSIGANSKVKPHIVKWFGLKDRAVRSKLLLSISSYINLFDESEVNEKIFPQLAQGFRDSNPLIREQTVRSLIHLAPLLNSKNLNEGALKELERLSTFDEENGIRANSTVCLGKIAKHLNSQTQQTILIPTLLRTLRDRFPPARQAAVAGLLTNESMICVKDCATKVMPALCHLCIDPEMNIRQLAFKSLRLLIERVQTHSEKEVAPKPNSSATDSHTVSEPAGPQLNTTSSKD